MASAPTRPLDVPPYQVQSLISNVVDAEGFGFDPSQVQVKCAQASGSEIYVGCSNGDLLRFSLQNDSYQLLSRQTLPSQKPIDQIVLVPCLARAFVLSDRTVHFYQLPTLEPVSLSTVKPIRHAVTFAIDHYDLQRPALSGGLTTVDPVNFCIIKRNAIAMYVMRERLSYIKEIPLPNGASHARRIGTTLLAVDTENYNLIDLHNVELIPIIPLSQAPPPTDPNEAIIPVNPVIEVIGADEFLILSSTGIGGTMGLFITTQGDPVRGTLQWPMHPRSVCLDYPYITALLPNDTIEIHNIDTQEIVQVVSAPAPSSALSLPNPFAPPNHSNTRHAGKTAAHPTPAPTKQRTALISSLNGYLVPSTQKSGKMGMVKVPLIRGGALPSISSGGGLEGAAPAEVSRELGSSGGGPIDKTVEKGREENDPARNKEVSLPEIALSPKVEPAPASAAIPVQEPKEADLIPEIALSPKLEAASAGAAVPPQEVKQDEAPVEAKEDQQQSLPSPKPSLSRSIAEEAEVVEALQAGVVAESLGLKESEREVPVEVGVGVKEVKEVEKEEIEVPVAQKVQEAQEPEKEEEVELPVTQKEDEKREEEEEQEEEEEAEFVYGEDEPAKKVVQEEEQEGEGEFVYGERDDQEEEGEGEGEFVYGQHDDEEEHEDDDDE